MTLSYSPDLLRKLFSMMCLIRFVEESFVEPINNREVLCPCHLYSGQEAIAAGLGVSLRSEDLAFGTHRSHGHYLAKGGNIDAMVAEIYCRETGCSKGRGGSMHLVAPREGFLGAAPIVGGTISLALGAAYAISVRRQKAVALSFFGDGATGEGVLFETMNFAALKKLPLILCCENNLYSTHMAIREMRHKPDIHDIAPPQGVASRQVDGNDVFACYEAGKWAVEHCKAGYGPVFLEFMTYRQRGHVGPDDNIQGTRTDIRPAEEIESWRKRDPLAVFEAHVLQNNLLSSAEIQQIKTETQKRVVEAHHKARSAPFPDGKEVSNFVFTN
ncbi:MAG TPA: thiamine pyrophosphate-dependent dehydrogenase E1 component subunit alpha [Candidatus Ozemobacteraceae bacterium]|nr:thiamine pyrophosphate-dependent dehydrogenase E1 component subunit alpha [Candidatus Ozemobacteraceae bacterium]